MSTRTKETIQTNQAWDTLYTRLDKDGLLEKAPATGTKRPFYTGKWQWAAAILLIGCSAVLLMNWPSKNMPAEKMLVTIKNQIGEGTLIKTLEDGSIVYLADNAELTYPEHFDPEKRIVSLKGKALFDVTGNKAHPFLIHTAYTDIEVIGTSFEIKSPDNQTFELSVLEGEVKVSSHNGAEELYVKAGDAVVITPDGKYKQGEIAKLDILHQMTRLVRFKDETVKDIIRVMNKSNTGTIVSVSPALENRRLTVAFSGHTPEEIAALLSAFLGVNYTKTDEIFMISE